MLPADHFRVVPVNEYEDEYEEILTPDEVNEILKQLEEEQVGEESRETGADLDR
ncbi:hypothetical protein [Cohnella cellulosilytica]|uniref:Uncharacterized protein n=1 Tax=Cohnella cellulosilytica TaxID=986710 RepID=A0ABW2FBD0_9BACL